MIYLATIHDSPSNDLRSNDFPTVATISLATISLATISLATISLATISLATISLATISFFLATILARCLENTIVATGPKKSWQVWPLENESLLGVTLLAMIFHPSNDLSLLAMFFYRWDATAMSGRVMRK